MRRKWGRGLLSNWLRNRSLPNLPPRRWGKNSFVIRQEPSFKPPIRKWGARKWFSHSGGIFSGNATYRPVKKFAAKRPKRKIKRSHFWLIMAVLTIFLMVQGSLFLDRELRQPLMFLAKIQVKQIATEAINAALSKEITQLADSNRMIDWKMREDGKVSGFQIDYKEQMAVTEKTIEVVTRVLKENEDVPDKIPIGHALNSPLISAIGPHVAVKFHPVSVVKVDVETEQREAGINMLLVEVFVRIRAEVAVVIPFDMEPEIVETTIPLSYALVVGDVPTYYYDGKGTPVGNGAAQAPLIALPGVSEEHSSE